MYQYTECGLDNVWLANGYTEANIGGETVVAVQNVEGLLRSIAATIAHKEGRLTPQEVRFLRHEMNESQSALGDLLGVQGQSIANWEKGRVPIPKAEDVLLRVLYCESIGDSSGAHRILDEAGKAATSEYRMFDTEDGWQGEPLAA